MELRTWWGWMTALAERVRSRRGVTVEQVLWIVFWVAAVGVVSVAVDVVPERQGRPDQVRR